MPGFAFLVIFVIIIISIFSNARKTSNGSSSNTSARQTGSGVRIQGKSGTNTNFNGTVFQGRPSGSQQAQPGTVQKNVKVVPNKESNPMYDIHTGESGDRCSTGYLLNESDRFDENAHPKLVYNQGIMARRHNDWDKVPQGYKVVKCCYCGAGNEVPNRKNGEYKCYFCWRKL